MVFQENMISRASPRAGITVARDSSVRRFSHGSTRGPYGESENEAGRQSDAIGLSDPRYSSSGEEGVELLGKPLGPKRFLDARQAGKALRKRPLIIAGSEGERDAAFE